MNNLYNIITYTVYFVVFEGHLQKCSDCMTPRTARWIARFLFVAYVILATVGLTLQAMTDTPYINTELPVLIILVILVGVWIVTGTLIISRHPHHPVGWLLCVGLFSPAIDMRAGSPFPRVYGTLTLALGSAVIFLELADPGAGTTITNPPMMLWLLLAGLGVYRFSSAREDAV